ncbi:MAG: aromatic ring-hydroxylating dioxygenase subunit alpha [Deltaproteobacteria bacterium]|nr:MAG: aromatic ring-hydroxylating dioxygenase subunit alpha [Deltaproteobacteria bacterium]
MMSPHSVESLLERQPKGSPLLREFYSDPEIFERDIERIHLRHWLCVGHQSRVREPGDWFRFDIAGESIIVVRGRDDLLRALVNVCRHRGSRVCYEAEGSARMLVCPYHAWTYDLDGRLRTARQMGPDFDVSGQALPELHLRVLEGLIFVCFAANPPGLESAERMLSASLRHYGWANARVAHRASYSVDANWKLVTENYMECYHCAPAHPEFSRHHATEKPDAEVAGLRARAARRARAMGIEIPLVLDWPVASAPDQEMADCSHDATFPGSVTGSEDGGPLAPLMGDFTDYDGGFTYLDVGPASFFLAYPDHGLIYLFTPRAPQKTDMEVLWLVRDDAREGKDYDRERLTWLWHVTSVADKQIIDQNQLGVNSRYYAPGPYGPMEAQTRSFVEWYLGQIHPSAK